MICKLLIQGTTLISQFAIIYPLILPSTIISMKSAQINKYGSSDVIQINQNTPEPSLSSGKVLVAIKAAGVNPVKDVENIPPIRITFPDGTQFFSDQSDIDHTLSKVIGREVSLMRASLDKPSYEEYWPDIEGLAQREKVTDEAMPPQTFFDIAVIHILTTSTINRLRELYPEGRFEVRRFRPNIVVESTSGEKDFIENLWVGKELMIGEEILLRVTGPCTRCVMTTLPQGDLPQDLGILHTVAKYNQVYAGVYASVHRGGTIHRGDRVQLEE
jgi:uncharacterized protein YcbX